MRKGLACAAAAFALLLLPAPTASGGEAGDSIRRIAEVFDGFDADKDGRLSAKEFEVGEFFAALDRNGDGFVTRDELKDAARDADAREAAGEEGPDAGGGKGGKPAPPGGGGKGKDGAGKNGAGRDGKSKDGKDRGGPGGMERGADEPFDDWAKRRIALDPRWNPEARVRQALRFFDRDPQDGKVERKEYPGEDGDRVFKKFDRNRDGALDAAELLPLAKDEIEDIQKQRKRPERGNFLTLYDIDDDRRVTAEEYAFLRGPERQFREFDRDADGTVTYEEIIDYRTDRERRRDAEAAARPRTLWDIHDADRDGRVSLEEFGGGESVFRRLDRNRDGYLTPADA